MGQHQAEWYAAFQNAWLQDPVQATLFVRANWNAVDGEMVAHALQIAAQTGGTAAMDHQIDVTMQTLGGAPGGVSGLGAVAASSAGFANLLQLVLQHQGDPPCSAALREHALAILQGQIPGWQALQLAGTQAPGMPAELQAVLPALMGTVLGVSMFEDPTICMALDMPGRLAAAMALPPEHLPLFVQVPPSAPAPPAPDEPTPERVEALKVRALEQLDQAYRSGDPTGELVAMQMLLFVAARAGLEAETVQWCASRLYELAVQRVEPEALAQIIGALFVVVGASELAGELDVRLAQAGEVVLKEQLKRKARVPLSLTTAQAWLRAGRSDLSAATLAALKQTHLKATERLQVAQIEADAAWNAGDREGAADLLANTLEEIPHASPEVRQATIQKLISLWPETRPGIEKWIDQFDRGLKAVEEPMRTLSTVQLVVALRQCGQGDRALAAAERVDFAAARAQVPPFFSTWIDEVEEWYLGQVSSTGSGGSEETGSGEIGEGTTTG